MSVDSNLGVVIAGAIGAGNGSGSLKAFRSIGSIVANITVEERHTDELTITEHPIEIGASIADHAFKNPAEVTLRLMWSNSPRSSNALGIPGSIAGALQQRASGQAQNILTNKAAKLIGGSAIGNLAVAQLSDNLGKLFVDSQINNGTGKGTSVVQDVYQSLLDLQSQAVPITVYTGKRRYDNMLIKSLTVETDIKTENSLSVLMVCRQVLLVATSVVAIPAGASDHADPAATVAPENTGTQQAVDRSLTEEEIAVLDGLNEDQLAAIGYSRN